MWVEQGTGKGVWPSQSFCWRQDSPTSSVSWRCGSCQCLDKKPVNSEAVQEKQEEVGWVLSVGPGSGLLLWYFFDDSFVLLSHLNGICPGAQLHPLTQGWSGPGELIHAIQAHRRWMDKTKKEVKWLIFKKKCDCQAYGTSYATWSTHL